MRHGWCLAGFLQVVDCLLERTKSGLEFAERIASQNFLPSKAHDAVKYCIEFVLNFFYLVHNYSFYFVRESLF